MVLHPLCRYEVPELPAEVNNGWHGELEDQLSDDDCDRLRGAVAPHDVGLHRVNLGIPAGSVRVRPSAPRDVTHTPDTAPRREKPDS